MNFFGYDQNSSLDEYESLAHEFSFIVNQGRSCQISIQFSLKDRMHIESLEPWKSSVQAPLKSSSLKVYKFSFIYIINIFRLVNSQRKQVMTYLIKLWTDMLDLAGTSWTLRTSMVSENQKKSLGTGCLSMQILYEPRQAKTCLQTCTKCADSEYPAHAQSIIRAFASHSNIL